MITANVNIPTMFSVYANSLGRNDTGYNCFQYYCQNCQQMFSVAWGRVPGAMAWAERGSYFNCPQCGTDYNYHRDAGDGKSHEHLPVKVTLTVKEYTNIVDLEVRYEAHIFREQFDMAYVKRMELFRFDIARQTATFSRIYHAGSKREVETTFEFGSPLEFRLFEESILRFFRPDCIANKEKGSDLSELLKILREAVKSRLEKRLGHKIESMWVSKGQMHGTFLLPLYNIGFRLIFPDAANLPEVYRDDKRVIENKLSDYMIGQSAAFMEKAIEAARSGADTATAICRAVDLPNKDAVRRELRENIFLYGWLASAFQTIENYDLAMRFFRAVRALQQEQAPCSHAYAYGYRGRDRSSTFTREVADFAKSMIPIYGEEGMVRMVESAEEYSLDDCIRLHGQLNADNKKAIKKDGVRLRDLHDWMARRHGLQNHKNVKIEVPKHIVNRMAMQRERLKFFLPQESIDLLVAGQSLHNCVGSYGQAMGNKELWIVLVADDNGKLAACLEIKKDQLVQAKIDRNKPVSTNPALNAEVLAWAKAAGVGIKTSDVRQAPKEATPAATAAG